ncbi:MAG: hypothetical protein NT067_00170 [Candidatus Diapherotrites archaeon]|nr:hypothetical protein [Candidatus Diapherotrites archaeon]
MNSRAQLSVEMLFTVLFLFTTVNILFAVSGSFTESQTEIHLRNQEIKIANSLSKILVASMAFEAADTHALEYTIPKLYVLGKTAPMPCTINFSSTEITITNDYGGPAVEIPYNGPDPGQQKCGGTLTIS